MRLKLVPVTALVTRKVKDDLLRTAKIDRRTLSAHIAGILTEWVFNRPVPNDERIEDKNHGNKENH